METNNNEIQNNQPPEIPESELKLPEEQFNGNFSNQQSNKNKISVLFVIVMLILLSCLVVLVVWGEQLINMLLPQPSLETGLFNNEMMIEEEPSNQASIESEVNSIESELEIESQNLDQFDAEMDEIENELDQI